MGTINKLKEGEYMVTLYNVMDIRDNRCYSVVIVSARKARFFVPIVGDEE